MGKLVTETPLSEINATLEVLDRFGIVREDLTRFRKASFGVQMEVVRLMKHGVLAPATPFPIWKTIIIGTILADANAFRLAHKCANCRIDDHANQLLGKITITKEPEALDLVCVSVAELGFKVGGRWKDIILRAQELGLSLCPAEVGPQLRLSYPNQPLDEWFAVAMDPIEDSDGRPRVFTVIRDHSRLWLLTSRVDSSYIWDSGSQLVFVRR